LIQSKTNIAGGKETVLLIAAAAASGVELIMLDNSYDPDIAIRDAEEFVDKRVDLVLEFQIEEAVAPRTARLAIFEEHKSMPWAAVWEHDCASQGVAEGISWLEKVRSYEKDTLYQRGGAQ